MLGTGGLLLAGAPSGRGDPGAGGDEYRLVPDAVGHGFTHNAFDLDDVFFRQAICLLIGSAQFVIIEHRCSRSKNRKHCILPCLRPFLCSLPLLFSRAFTPIPRRTGGDERHILHLLRHKIRKTGRLSLSVEEVSGFHSHL